MLPSSSSSLLFLIQRFLTLQELEFGAPISWVTPPDVSSRFPSSSARVEDIPIIEEECSKYGLKLQESLEKNKWVSLKFLN